MKRMFFTCQTLFMIIVCVAWRFSLDFSSASAPPLSLLLYDRIVTYTTARTQHSFLLPHQNTHISSVKDDDFRTINSNRTTHTNRFVFSIDVYNWINVKHEKFILSAIFCFWFAYTQTHCYRFLYALSENANHPCTLHTTCRNVSFKCCGKSVRKWLIYLVRVWILYGIRDISVFHAYIRTFSLIHSQWGKKEREKSIKHITF